MCCFSVDAQETAEIRSGEGTKSEQSLVRSVANLPSQRCKWLQQRSLVAGQAQSRQRRHDWQYHVGRDGRAAAVASENSRGRLLQLARGFAGLRAAKLWRGEQQVAVQAQEQVADPLWPEILWLVGIEATNAPAKAQKANATCQFTFSTKRR